MTISMETTSRSRSALLARTTRRQRMLGTEGLLEDHELRCEPYRPDCYIVLVGGDVVGYIDLVGHLFVALAGEHYDRAVEVAQTHALGTAAEALRGSRA